MAGFSDPITAGDVLIRSAIKSPNYVASTSGWTINQDGTAEFNSLTIYQGDILLYKSGVLRLKVSATPDPAVHIYDSTGVERVQLTAASDGNLYFYSTNSDETAPGRLHGFTSGGYARLEMVGPELLGHAAGRVLIDNQDVTIQSASHAGDLYLDTPAGRILIPSEMRSTRGATSDPVLTSRAASATNDRFKIVGDGGLSWGDGTNAPDANLYRSGTALLETQSSLNVLGKINSTRGATSDPVLTSRAASATNDRFKIVGDGGLSWGDGTNNPDTNLYRAGAGLLETQGGLNVQADLYIAGKIGFYGTAVQAKKTVTGSRAGNAALASLLTQLAAYGLIVNNSTA